MHAYTCIGIQCVSVSILEGVKKKEVIPANGSYINRGLYINSIVISILKLLSKTVSNICGLDLCAFFCSPGVIQ